jgi:hypothetical protein
VRPRVRRADVPHGTRRAAAPPGPRRSRRGPARRSPRAGRRLRRAPPVGRRGLGPARGPGHRRGARSDRAWAAASSRT